MKLWALPKAGYFACRTGFYIVPYCTPYAIILINVLPSRRRPNWLSGAFTLPFFFVKWMPCFLWGCYDKTIKRISCIEMSQRLTGFGLYDNSFTRTLRQLHNPIFPEQLLCRICPHHNRYGEISQLFCPVGRSRSLWNTLQNVMDTWIF